MVFFVCTEQFLLVLVLCVCAVPDGTYVAVAVPASAKNGHKLSGGELVPGGILSEIFDMLDARRFNADVRMKLAIGAPLSDEEEALWAAAAIRAENPAPDEPRQGSQLPFSIKEFPR